MNQNEQENLLNEGQFQELGANTNLVITKDCQTAHYPKPDEMAGDHGH